MCSYFPFPVTRQIMLDTLFRAGGAVVAIRVCRPMLGLAMFFCNETFSEGVIMRAVNREERIPMQAAAQFSLLRIMRLSVLEEILFRGFCWDFFADIFADIFASRPFVWCSPYVRNLTPYMTNLVVAALFSRMHHEPGLTWRLPIVLLVTFVDGLIFGSLRIASGNLYASCLAHMMSNLLVYNTFRCA